MQHEKWWKPAIATAFLMLIHGTAAAETRLVQHAMGESLVPVDPQRVVILTNEGTEALLALGVTPVGAVRSWHGDPWYDYLEAQLDDVAAVGTEFELDLGRIRTLRPDLIIANKLRHEGLHDTLSAIAPTVMSAALYGNWKGNLEFYAAVLGREAEAKAALHAFDRRVADLSRLLRPHLTDRLSLVRFMPDQTWAYCRNSFGGTILAQLGFARPAFQDVNTFTLTVARDQIPELDGDRLFYFVYETGDGQAAARAQSWTSDPRWQALDAVRNGKAVAVSDAIWTTAGGIMAANLLLDDIARLYGLGD